MTVRVGEEEMIRTRIVLIDAPLHEAHSQDAKVEVEVRLRIARDTRDVMNAADVAHSHVPFELGASATPKHRPIKMHGDGNGSNAILREREQPTRLRGPARARRHEREGRMR